MSQPEPGLEAASSWSIWTEDAGSTDTASLGLCVPKNRAKGLLRLQKTDTSLLSLLQANGTGKEPEFDAAENYGFECSTCLTDFGDQGESVPRNLDCGHTFCTGCLENFVSNCTIACPKCRRATFCKEARNLPKNYGVIEIIGGAASCTASPRMPRRTHAQQEAPLYCPDHGDHLSAFCVTDNKLVCSSCLLYGDHKHHKCVMLTEAMEQRRQLLTSLIHGAVERQKKMESALTEVEDLAEKMQSSGGRILDEVNAHFDVLAARVEERRREMKVDLMKRIQLRVCALQNQARLLRDSIEKASAAHTAASDVLKGSKLDIHQLFGSSVLVQQLESVFINPVPTLPLAMDDLTCGFSEDLREEVVSLVDGYGVVKSMAAKVKSVFCHPFHDGIRVTWSPHNFVDNHGITYHLQVATGDGDFVNLFRGGNTKFTWYQELRDKVSYWFRVQVRTTEDVGNWSTPVEAKKAAPAFVWSDQWRNLRIELSPDRLEAWWGRGSNLKYWASFGSNTILGHGVHYMEIEIIELGKLKPNKKLALGVIECSGADMVKAIDWQYGEEPVGNRNDVKSWGFQPILGVIMSSVQQPASSSGGKHPRLSSSALPPPPPPAHAEGKPYAKLSLQNGDRIGMLVDMLAGQLHFFCNRQDLGLAFDNVHAQNLLPVVSIRDKIRLRLLFPPPPYQSRIPQLTRLTGLDKL